MSYEKALKAAGAEVIDYREFGSYQGDWWALVEYQGKRAWAHGAFGSCSYCDAFQAEVGCDYEAEDYESKLAQFGASYLSDLWTQEAAEKEAAKYIEWDREARDMLDFIKSKREE